LAVIYRNLAVQIRLVQALDSLTYAYESASELADKHGQIVDAIVSGSSAKAGRAILEHIDDAERKLLTALRRDSATSAGEG
jgi:DNA-binding GntR family transcriptional regulator